jgi:hypothetical protein
VGNRGLLVPTLAATVVLAGAACTALTGVDTLSECGDGCTDAGPEAPTTDVAGETDAALLDSRGVDGAPGSDGPPADTVSADLVVGDAGDAPVGPVELAMAVCPADVKVDASYVYFTNNSGTVMKVHKDGSGLTTIYTGSAANRLAIDATNFYVTDITANAVIQCPLAGCSGNPLVLAPSVSAPWGIAVDATTVYWANNGDGTIMKCAIGGCGAGTDGGGPTILATGQTNAQDLVVAGGTVYWVASGTVAACATGGCGGSPTVLASPGGTVQALAVDSANVYWVNAVTPGSVSACAIAGCATTIRVLAQNLATPSAVAVDATDVYWPNNGDGQVESCPIAGCPGGPRIVATGPPGTDHVTLDSTTVYWAINTGNGGVFAAPK